jgi:hypothetical protein
MNAVNIKISFHQVVDMIKQLSPSEKLKINEVIWETDTEIPSEHQLLVMERIKKTKNNPKRMLDWDEVSKNL